MPSLHCGFAFAVSVAPARTAARPLARLLALACAPVIFLAVVATGNHFVSDIAGGVAITVLGFGLTNRGGHGRRPAPATWPV